MMKVKQVVAGLLLATVGFSLTACGSENAKEVVSQIQSLKYTGDATTDLRNLCNLSSSINKLSNEQKDFVNKHLVKATNEYSQKSDSEEVQYVATLLEMSTSTDSKVRAKGEKELATACATI